MLTIQSPFSSNPPRSLVSESCQEGVELFDLVGEIVHRDLALLGILRSLKVLRRSAVVPFFCAARDSR
jgi:hypothetical protein